MYSFIAKGAAIWRKRWIGLMVGLAATPSWGGEIFVAPHGKDAEPGTRERPVATLQRAAELVRRERLEATTLEPTTVWIASGTYSLIEGLHLTEADSGTAAAPIAYRAEPGAEVRLTGGHELTNWTRLAAADVDPHRLDADVRGRVRVAELDHADEIDCGEHAPRGTLHALHPAPLELFCDDIPMTLARWPNAGWARTTAASAEGRIAVSAPRRAHWSHEPDAWLHGFWSHDWEDSYARIVAAHEHAVTTESTHGAVDCGAQARFRAVNLLCELDAPGEYYVCRERKRLYFLPPSADAIGRTVVSCGQTLVSTYGVSHVTFSGLTLEVGRVCGLEIVGGSDVSIVDCTFRNFGNLAVSIYGGQRHCVVDSRLHDLGEGAIRVDGGDTASLTRGEHVVANNRIERFNRWGHGYRPAVNVYGVGHRVSQNLIAHGSHAAVLLHGNEHVVEANEIHSVCCETDDAGAIMLIGDWTERGNLIRRNYVHDVGCADAQCVVGIYLDDFASGTIVAGNALVRTGRGVLIGGGRDNDVTGNLIVGCRAGVQIDSRGQTWRSEDTVDAESPLRTKLAAALAEGSPYRERYPALVGLLDDQPGRAIGNRVAGNVCPGPHAIDLHDGLDRTVVTIKSNFTAGDPKFIAAERGDYRLQNDSPVYRIGFEPIVWESIGVQARSAEWGRQAAWNAAE